MPIAISIEDLFGNLRELNLNRIHPISTPETLPCHCRVPHVRDGLIVGLVVTHEFPPPRGRGLRMHLEFNSDRRRSLRKCQSALSRLRALYGMHRLRLHPLYDPLASRNWRLFTRVIVDASVRPVVPNMGCTATGVRDDRSTPHQRW